jgi:hypothetical protein
MENNRYKITSYTLDKTSFFSSEQKESTDYCKTRQELDIMVDIIKSDTTIIKSFYTDLANGNVTHIK